MAKLFATFKRWMMKRVGHLIEQIACIDNLYMAYHKACRGKQRKTEVKRFAERLDENILQLRQGILDDNVPVGNYHYFQIRDPKERQICAAPFEERVLHHAIMNVCHPFFDKTLIDTTYATRKGKGIYAALDEAKTALGRYEHTVKLDFRKYYDSISHDVLKQKLRRLFKDERLLRLFDKIIDTYCVEKGKGLPIGNLTSQYFANTYLSSLDHRAKEQWHVPVYIRYMDDILIAGNDKTELVECVRQMVEYAAEALQLTFKPPIYRKSKDGQVFLGYRVLPCFCRLSGRSKRRFRSKLLKYERHLERNEWNEQTYQEHIVPLLAFTGHADSKAFRRACMNIG